MLYPVMRIGVLLGTSLVPAMGQPAVDARAATGPWTTVTYLVQAPRPHYYWGPPVFPYAPIPAHGWPRAMVPRYVVPSNPSFAGNYRPWGGVAHVHPLSPHGQPASVNPLFPDEETTRAVFMASASEGAAAELFPTEAMRSSLVEALSQAPVPDGQLVEGRPTQAVASVVAESDRPTPMEAKAPVMPSMPEEAQRVEGRAEQDVQSMIVASARPLPVESLATAKETAQDVGVGAPPLVPALARSLPGDEEAPAGSEEFGGSDEYGVHPVLAVSTRPLPVVAILSQ